MSGHPGNGITADGIDSSSSLTLNNVTANSNGGASCSAGDDDGNGLFAASVSGTLSITSSTFDSNCDNGILVNSFGSSSSTTITATSASTNGFKVDFGGNGLELNDLDGTLMLINVTANDNNDDGLDGNSDDEEPNITATGGSYSSNGDDGFDLDGLFFLSTLTINGVIASSNDDKGFDLDNFEDSTITISNATADDNGDTGFDIDEIDGGTVQMTGALARNNGDEGIAFDDVHAGASVTVSNSDSSNNLEDGLDIDDPGGSSFTVTGNTLSGNSESGIEFERIQGFVTLSITNSCIQNNRGESDGNFSSSGIALRDVPDNFEVGDPGSITMSNNNITGNVGGSLRIEDVDLDGDAPVNAMSNWWGASDGPAPGGSGDAIDEVDSNSEIDASNHLTSLASGTPCSLSAPPSSAPPVQVTVTVTKAVAGDAPAGAAFAFTLDCLGFDDSFSPAAGESHTTANFPANTLCSLSETDNGGAASVSGEFSNVLITSNQTFIVTNTFVAAPPEVLGTAVTKTLTSTNPAAVGETVTFDVAVTFSGGELRTVELIDVFEHDVLALEGASALGTPLTCQVLANVPDSSYSTAVCALGDASGPFTVQLRFTALSATVPGATVNEASLVSDQDGLGGDPPTTTGPVAADVEIVEVLALAPLGEGEPIGSDWRPWLLVALTALVAVTGRLATASGRARG